jgi:hypothetical protein
MEESMLVITPPATTTEESMLDITPPATTTEESMLDITPPMRFVIIDIVVLKRRS